MTKKRAGKVSKTNEVQAGSGGSLNDTKLVRLKRLLNTGQSNMNNANAVLQGAQRTVLAQAHSLGRILKLLKSRVGHGDWGKWLAANTMVDGRQSISDRTASRYMLIATHLSKSDLRTDLTIVGASKLIRQRMSTSKAQSVSIASDAGVGQNHSPAAKSASELGSPPLNSVREILKPAETAIGTASLRYLLELKDSLQALVERVDAQIEDLRRAESIRDRVPAGKDQSGAPQQTGGQTVKKSKKASGREKKPAHPLMHKNAETLILEYLSLEERIVVGTNPVTEGQTLVAQKHDFQSLITPLLLQVLTFAPFGLEFQAIRRMLFRHLIAGTQEFDPVKPRTAARFVKSALIQGFLIKRAKVVETFPALVPPPAGIPAQVGAA